VRSMSCYLPPLEVNNGFPAAVGFSCLLSGRGISFGFFCFPPLKKGLPGSPLLYPRALLLFIHEVLIGTSHTAFLFFYLVA